jgi:DNA-binding beta-propeller fold protein YncE
VIRTASNTVVATVPVGNSPNGVAITPDGKAPTTILLAVSITETLLEAKFAT